VCVDGECDAREERVALPLLIICAGRVVNSVHVIWDATTPVDRAAVDRMLPVSTRLCSSCLDGCIGAVHGASPSHASVMAMNAHDDRSDDESRENAEQG